MSKNNFQRLSDENITPRAKDQIEKTTKEIDASVSFVKMIGNIVEMYLPRVFDVFMMMSGAQQRGTPVEQEDTTLPPSSGGSGQITPNSGPSNPDL